MFDFGFGEILLLAVVALVVLGPEKMPHAARMAGAWLGRLRRTVAEIQSELEQEVAIQEMRNELKKQLDSASSLELRQQLQAQLELVESNLKAFKRFSSFLFTQRPAHSPASNIRHMGMASISIENASGGARNMAAKKLPTMT